MIMPILIVLRSGRVLGYPQVADAERFAADSLLYNLIPINGARISLPPLLRPMDRTRLSCFTGLGYRSIVRSECSEVESVMQR